MDPDRLGEVPTVAFGWKYNKVGWSQVTSISVPDTAVPSTLSPADKSKLANEKIV